MNLPTVALCNFIPDTAALRKMAAQHGFSSVDWTFKLEDIQAALGLTPNEMHLCLSFFSHLKGSEGTHLPDDPSKDAISCYR